MSPKITVTISPTGETSIETAGFRGASCQGATRALVAALGLVLQDRPTPDFYLPAATQQTHSVRS